MRFSSKNIIGENFGNLTVIEKLPNLPDSKGRNWITFYRCQCVCGKICDVRYGCLKSGNTKSCGCTKAHKLEYGEASFNRVFRVYKKKCK